MRFRFTAITIILLIAVGLLTLVVPRLRRSRQDAKNTDIVVADLRRLEVAENQYAADHRKEPGTKVRMKDLVKDRYLAREPRAPGNG